MGKTFAAVAKKKDNMKESNEVLQNRAVGNMLNSIWNRDFYLHHSPEQLLDMVRMSDGSKLSSPTSVNKGKDPMGAITEYFNHYPNGRLQIINPGDDKPRWLSRGEEDGNLVFNISDEKVAEPERKPKPGFLDYFKAIFSKEAREKISIWNQYKQEKKRYDEFSARGKAPEQTAMKNGEGLGFELKDIDPNSIKTLHKEIMEKNPDDRNLFETNYYENLNDPKLRELGKYALLAQNKLNNTTMKQYNEDMATFKNGFYAGPASHLYTVWLFNKVANDEELSNQLQDTSLGAFMNKPEFKKEFVNQFAVKDNGSALDINAVKEYSEKSLLAEPKIYKNSVTIASEKRAQERLEEAKARHEKAMSNPSNEIEKMYRDFSGQSETLKALGDKAMVAMDNIQKDVSVKYNIRYNKGMEGLDADVNHGLAYDMGTVVSFRLACQNDSYRQALEKMGADEFVNKMSKREEFIKLVRDDDSNNMVDHDLLKGFSVNCGSGLAERLNDKFKKTFQDSVANELQKPSKTVKEPEAAAEKAPQQNTLNY